MGISWVGVAAQGLMPGRDAAEYLRAAGAAFGARPKPGLSLK
jgi:hypothetical protein